MDLDRIVHKLDWVLEDEELKAENRRVIEEACDCLTAINERDCTPMTTDVAARILGMSQKTFRANCIASSEGKNPGWRFGTAVKNNNTRYTYWVNEKEVIGYENELRAVQIQERKNRRDLRIMRASDLPFGNL